LNCRPPKQKPLERKRAMKGQQSPRSRKKIETLISDTLDMISARARCLPMGRPRASHRGIAARPVAKDTM